MGKGDVPATVLFVGEGPGKSEDLMGIPFCGASGVLLHAAIDAVNTQRISTYFANILACRPCDEHKGPNRPPTLVEAAKCQPRLEQISALVKPEVVILLGKVTQKFGKILFPDAYHLMHPAYILRVGGQRSPTFRIFKRQLQEIFDAV